MPVIPLQSGAVVLVTFRGELNGQRILNTFQYHIKGTPDPAVDYHEYLDKLFTGLAVSGFLMEHFLGIMPSNYFLERVRIQPTYPIRQRYEDYISGDPGQWAQTAKTSNLTASIRRVTDVIGPRGVGRIQLALPDDAYLDGKLSDTGGYVTAAGLLGVDMLAEITTTVPTAVWEPVIFTTLPTVNMGVVIDAVPEDTVRVMRRRTVRLGE